MDKLIVILFIVCSVIHPHAQNPFARYKVEHYDSKNGMPNDFVMNTYQSKDGFIWLNSYSGYIRSVQTIYLIQFQQYTCF